MVRLLTVLITLLVTGVPLIVYFVMYLVVPDKSEVIGNKNEYEFNDDDYIY